MRREGKGSLRIAILRGGAKETTLRKEVGPEGRKKRQRRRRT